MDRDIRDCHQYTVTKFTVFHQYSEHNSEHNWSEQKTKEINSLPQFVLTDSLAFGLRESYVGNRTVWWTAHSNFKYFMWKIFNP